MANIQTASRKIRILIADDSEEIRNYLRKIITNENNFEVIDMVASAAGAVKAAIQLNPDIVLMDIQMETRTAGIEGIKKIRDYNPSIKNIVLTVHNQDNLIYQAYTAGAMDYIVKTSNTRDILNSLCAVANNNLILRPEIANRLMSICQRIQEEHSTLKEILKIMMGITNTEFEIIKLVYYGNTYKNIAKQRFVEETTIRTEIHRILQKFKKKKMKDVINTLQDINFFKIFDF
jgi:DNA-binding NarL/FixJ family response regulator